MKLAKITKKDFYKSSRQNDAWRVMAFDAVYDAIKNNPVKSLNMKFDWKQYFYNIIIDLRKSKKISKAQNKMLQEYFFEFALNDFDEYSATFYPQSCYRKIYIGYHRLINAS